MEAVVVFFFLLLFFCIIVTQLSAYSSPQRETQAANLIELISNACIQFGFKLFQVLGHWFEVERSFYLPEIASGCTTFEFQPYSKAELSKFNNFKLEVAIKTINRM